MRNWTDEPRSSSDRANDWTVAVTIALCIAICLTAFVWIFIELEPFMGDFVGSDVVATPDPYDPLGTPTTGP